MQVTNLYCGSIFVGHCGSKQLLEHFHYFVKDLSLHCKLLLHIGMDGPNVNKSFHQKLVNQLKEEFDTFRKGVSELTYDVDFLKDFHLFFQVF